ncbi:unnamed protein product [Xylocopa violacea]|uniref:Uncharacterized protein n=1 Tax=Xylocopa violacea TaxID=135666 RepID=A0ABP1P097_XYLVO
MREAAPENGMVSFKSNNVDSDRSTPHRHLPGSLCGSLDYSDSSSHSHRHNHLHRHDPPLPPAYCAPPPPLSSSYSTVQRSCALHSR